MKWKRRERESKVCGRELLSQNTFLPLVSCTTFKPKNNPGKKLPYSSMTNSWNFVYTLCSYLILMKTVLTRIIIMMITIVVMTIIQNAIIEGKTVTTALGQ